MSGIIESIEKAQLKEHVDQFNVGDTVRVYAKIREGEKERIQMFEGTVLKRQNGGIRETFIFSLFALIPTAQLSLKETMTSDRSLTDCRKLYAITGMNTFSSKLPWLAANPIAASLPIT